MKRAYIGNIPFNISEDDLLAWFCDYQVENVQVIRHRDTGKSRGFAFVEFKNEKDFEAALKTHDGLQLGGRRVIVNDAAERRGGR